MKKTCLNPSCKKVFECGHYRNLQLICRSKLCLLWYKAYYSETRKPPREIPEADLERILGAVKRDTLWYSLFLTASRSGLRKGELLGLAWNDVLEGDGIRKTIKVRGQWDEPSGTFKATKTGKSRIGYLFEDAREALKAHLTRVRRDKEWNLTGRVWPVPESTTWRHFVAVQKKLKIVNPETGRPFRFHDCRHVAAHRILRATKDIKNAQELLGHKNPSTTQIYTQRSPEEYATTMEDALRKRRGK